MSTLVSDVSTTNRIHRPNSNFSIKVYPDPSLSKAVRVDKCLKRALYNILNNMSQICGLDGLIDMFISSTYQDSTSTWGQNSNFFVRLVSDLAFDMNIVDVVNSFQRYYNADFTSSPEDASIIDSLTYSLNQSLSLGWFIAFNVIQNLGGLLECSIQDGKLMIDVGLLVEYSDYFIDPSESTMTTSEVSKQSTPKFVRVHESDIARMHLVADRLDIAKITNPVAATPIRILIVDDSPICRKVMVKSLSDIGYNTEIACDGRVSPYIPFNIAVFSIIRSLVNIIRRLSKSYLSSHVYSMWSSWICACQSWMESPQQGKIAVHPSRDGCHNLIRYDLLEFVRKRSIWCQSHLSFLQLK